MKDLTSTMKDGTSTVNELTPPREASGWETLVLEYGKDVLRERIRGIIHSTATPWRDIDGIPKPPGRERVKNDCMLESMVQSTVQQSVMNVLQEVFLTLG